jgi:hypothetical protein
LANLPTQSLHWRNRSFQPIVDRFIGDRYRSKTSQAKVTNQSP